MVFNATFNNISVISWWSVLLVEETGGPGEMLVVIGTDCTNSCKSNYHTITSTAALTGLELRCLMPLSIQLYRGDQFYWWRKPEDPEKTTDLSQVTEKLFLYCICVFVILTVSSFPVTCMEEPTQLITMAILSTFLVFSVLVIKSVKI